MHRKIQICNYILIAKNSLSPANEFLLNTVGAIGKLKRIIKIQKVKVQLIKPSVSDRKGTDIMISSRYTQSPFKAEALTLLAQHCSSPFKTGQAFALTRRFSLGKAFKVNPIKKGFG